MNTTITKNTSFAILIFAAGIILASFGGCKTKDTENVPKPAISGVYTITKVEITADSGKTWSPQGVGCLASGVFTFNTSDVLVYTKSACQGDGDFTGKWIYNSTSKELAINMANGDNWWDGIAKDVTSTSFVLDESAIPNAQFHDRVTFTKK
ncbi:MAG: hypothetical protein ABIN13_05860 [Mucilaginibacter sp.]